MPGGRPLKLSPLVRKKLCELISAGLTEKGACGGTGIAYITFQRWKRIGEASLALPKEQRAPEDKGFRMLCVAVNDAREQARASLEAIVMKHAREDGRLALEVLSRKDPEDWGRRDRHRHEGVIQHEVIDERTARDELARRLGVIDAEIVSPGERQLSAPVGEPETIEAEPVNGESASGSRWH